MSLILDALRKSEAERRRGQAPDLLADPLPAAASARARSQRRKLAYAIAATAVVLALVLAIRFGGNTPSDGEPLAAVGSVAADAPRSDASAPERASAPASSTASGASSGGASPEPASIPPAAPLSPPRVQPAPVANTALAQQALGPSLPASAAATPPAAPIEPPAPTNAPAVAPPTPAAAALPPAFTSPDATLRLGDLSAEERQQLPPLKVSMHMWAPEAANRFAIIDGSRVNEGDRVGDATVESIQADGVMLSWRGRRVQLPIR